MCVVVCVNYCKAVGAGIFETPCILVSIEVPDVDNIVPTNAQQPYWFSTDVGQLCFSGVIRHVSDQVTTVSHVPAGVETVRFLSSDGDGFTGRWRERLTYLPP